MTHGNKYLVGYMEPYIKGEKFDDYLERLENYMELNNVQEDKIKVLLLSNLIGPESSAKLSKAFKPGKPKDHKYEDVVKKCEELFAPKFTTCVNVVKFNKRIQQKNESINDYAIELMTLAELCEFGDYKDKALRNQFISGIRHIRLKAELMSLNDKTKFEEVLQKAVAAETIQRDVEAHSSNVDGINKVQSSYRWRSSSRGNYGHFNRNRSKSRNRGNSRSSSHNRSIRCYNCQGYGHMARDCVGSSWRTLKGHRGKYGKYDKYREKFPNRENNFKGYDRTKLKNSVGNVDSRDSTNVDVVDSYNFGNLSLYDNTDTDIDNVTVSVQNYKKSVNSVNNCKEGMKTCNQLNGSVNQTKVELVDVIVENLKIKMEIDTGACVSLCAVSLYKKYFSHLKLLKTDLPLSVLTGDKILVVGKIVVSVKLREGDKDKKVELLVVDTPKRLIPLCGRDWLDELFGNWREWFKVNQIDDNVNYQRKYIQQIRNDFDSVFDEI